MQRFGRKGYRLTGDRSAGERSARYQPARDPVIRNQVLCDQVIRDRVFRDQVCSESGFENVSPRRALPKTDLSDVQPRSLLAVGNAVAV